MEDCSKRSLYALHGVLIVLRSRAYHSKEQELASGLDVAEHLVRIISHLEDETEGKSTFGEFLKDLAERDPGLGIALSRFQQESVPEQW